MQGSVSASFETPIRVFTQQMPVLITDSTAGWHSPLKVLVASRRTMRNSAATSWPTWKSWHRWAQLQDFQLSTAKGRPRSEGKPCSIRSCACAHHLTSCQNGSSTRLAALVRATASESMCWPPFAACSLNQMEVTTHVPIWGNSWQRLIRNPCRCCWEPVVNEHSRLGESFRLQHLCDNQYQQILWQQSSCNTSQI